MSVIGFDIGNERCVIAAAKRDGIIDVLLDDDLKRETPSVVSFGEKQRFLGSAGAAAATANPNSTISQVKRLIGRVFKDPSVQKDLQLLPFVTSEDPSGGILIELEYLKEKMKFTPVEILGMLFTHLKQIAEKNLESNVIGCVIGIPSYFTDWQRHEYLNAARIAGLHRLRLIHDCTATALGYGMYKTDFHHGGPTYVIFVDIGHCDTQVTVAAFEEGIMKILSHSFDQNLGGRDFDEVLFKYFATRFKDEHEIEVSSNPRASIRLRASCEKVKKVLSACAEAPINIDSLIDDQDVREIITREKFEELSSELLRRVTVPCLEAIKDSDLSIDDISIIELVGSGSRIPAITKRLASLFHRKPTRTLNSSECVAIGCALHGAMLSPTRREKKYEIVDVVPYSIGMTVVEDMKRPQKEITLFVKGKPFPYSKKHYTQGIIPFRMHISYADKTDFPTRITSKNGHFLIVGSKHTVKDKVTLEFGVKLNENGIVEIEYIISNLAQKNFLPWASETSKFTSVQKFDFANTKDELHKSREREKMLGEQDIKVEQAKDQRNTLESFVYDTRSKLSTTYKSFATDSEAEKITNSLQEAEDWLYEDNDDESEQDYTGKLQDLKKLLGPIENKYKEKKAIEEIITDLEYQREKVSEHFKALEDEMEKTIEKHNKLLEYQREKHSEQVKALEHKKEKAIEEDKGLQKLIEECRLAAELLSCGYKQEV